jgi:hypothetical protein
MTLSNKYAIPPLTNLLFYKKEKNRIMAKRRPLPINVF